MTTGYTLVTGASRGIGAAFARRLAAAGQPLILTARDSARLQALQAELRDRHAVPVETVALDLAAAGAAEALCRHCEAAGWVVEMLVNNAGFGRVGAFEAQPLADYEAMLRVNVAGPMALCRHVLPAMKARGRGAIVNVASLAAFQPTPYLAVYGATKAFLLAFSEALAAECAGTGVRVLALCPGPTRTEFFAVAGFGAGRTPDMPLMQTPEAVVEAALNALQAGRFEAIPGWRNRLLAGVSRHLPRRWLLPLSARAMRTWCEDG